MMTTTCGQYREPTMPFTGSSAPVRRAFRTPVRGHAFAARSDDGHGPAVGQLARLLREPANPADELAVGVWVAGQQGRWRIGYLDRSVAARIAPRLDAGARIAARIEGWTAEPDGRWQRPLLVLLPDPDADSREGDPPSDGHAEAEASRSDQPATTARPAPAEVRAPSSAARAAGLWGRPPGVLRRVVR